MDLLGLKPTRDQGLDGAPGRSVELGKPTIISMFFQQKRSGPSPLTGTQFDVGRLCQSVTGAAATKCNNTHLNGLQGLVSECWYGGFGEWNECAEDVVYRKN